MDESAQCVSRDEPKKPKHNQDSEDSPKHSCFPLQAARRRHQLDRRRAGRSIVLMPEATSFHPIASSWHFIQTSIRRENGAIVCSLVHSSVCKGDLLCSSTFLYVAIRRPRAITAGPEILSKPRWALENWISLDAVGNRLTLKKRPNQRSVLF